MENYQFEPNYMTFEHNNIKCEIIRHEKGFLLGYIYIPQNNIYYGLDELLLNQTLKCREDITFAEEHKSFWKIGFDFAHINDFTPGLEKDEEPEIFQLLAKAFPLEIKKEYRGIEQAINILKELAEELTT